MFQRKIRRFNRRSNGRNHNPRFGSNEQRPRSNSFINGQTRNKFRTPLSAEKLFEKYKSLAQEAMSSGDKTLSENYFQHADHFMRILSERKFNQNKIKTETIKSDIQSSEKEDVKTNQNTTGKKE